MKKIRFSIVFLGLLAGSFQALAQTPEQETRYQNGRTLLDQQKYELAMNELLPLTSLAAGNPRAAEASYLYALAASKANKTAEANAMLQQLIGNFPEWGNIEEAYYLAAKMAFDQQNYEKALLNLQVVRSAFIRPDADALERYYLNQLSDKNRFKNLLQQFPDDKVLAQVYAGKLRSGWYRDEDRPVLENLVKKFGLDAGIYNPDKLKRNQKKDAYNVAVLLPFQVYADDAARRRNQFAADLYAGMKLAQDSLAKNNIKVNLFTYDSDTDTLSTFNILQLPELKSMDLVIGPVYKSSAAQAARFARRHQINFVNPLSEDLEVVKDQPFMFMFETSVITRAQKAADFAFENFEPKVAAILFENSRDDTVFAHAYRKQFEMRGGTVKLFKKIDTRKNPNVMAVYKGVDLKNFGHLVMVSDRLAAAVSTLSQVATQNPTLPVLTNESWLEMPQISLSQLDELEVYFIHPRFMDNNAPAVRRFRSNYLKRYNIPPSRYAFAGYEMLYFFGNLLHNHGPQFQTFLPEIPTVSGVFYKGFYYNNAPDNQVVPILKMEDRRLVQPATPVAPANK